jgi:organic radical activating enzyme
MQYLLNDIFWTYQGEGLNSGKRALFVRLPNCNLTCSWCDTKFNTHKAYDRQWINEFIYQENSRFAVITGGEPLMNPQIKDVISLLKEHGFFIACETNGTMPYAPGIDFVTCSPKAQSCFKINAKIRDHVNEYKYVVDEFFEFDLLDRHYNEEGKTYWLSPEFNTLESSINRISDFIRKNPHWRLNTQTHKFLGLK